MQNGQAEVEAESDGDGEQKEVSKIEPTTAEAEALAQGLQVVLLAIMTGVAAIVVFFPSQNLHCISLLWMQTIRNDDLEEIRELGSGTYGSVFHGKWKGSDVAIKRIKASCFTGKPYERERLVGYG